MQAAHRSRAQVAAATAAQAALVARVRAFFDAHDLLLCPACMAAPFDVDVRRAATPGARRPRATTCCSARWGFAAPISEREGGDLPRLRQPS